MRVSVSSSLPHESSVAREKILHLSDKVFIAGIKVLSKAYSVYQG